MVESAGGAVDHAGAGVEHHEANPEAFGGVGGGSERVLLGLKDALDEVGAIGAGEFPDGEMVDGAVALEGGEVGAFLEYLGEFFRVGLGENGGSGSAE